MHFTNLLLSLLTLSVSAPAIAARVPHGNAHGKRTAAHRGPDVEALRRQGTLAMEAREGLTQTPKSKRLVKKKRNTCGAVSNATHTVAPVRVAGAPSSSTPGSSTPGGQLYPISGGSAAPSSSAWSSSTWSAASSTSSQAAHASKSSTTAWSSSSAAPTPSSATGGSGTSDWTLVAAYEGSDFFSNWTFWDYADPTHGTVNYISESEAWSTGLISINSDNHAIMSIDTTEVISGGRNSIRISGDLTFTGGMVILDVYHIPTGCATWPAFWSNGPNWPQGGEIDMLEGVNVFTQNQVSLHTDPGCNMPSDLDSNQTGTLSLGSGYNAFDCSAADTGNQGCGVKDETNDNSYGAPFNNAGGGVYALVWVPEAIEVWFFTRSKIPADITAGTPDPSGWGTPVANFPSTDCDLSTYFYEHYSIIDTTLCGDWAGADSVWTTSGYGGQTESCAQITGYSTCADFVQNSGSSFAGVYWEIASVKYYNSTQV